MTSVYESLLSDYPDKGVVGKPEFKDTDEALADKLYKLFSHFQRAKANGKAILVLIGAGVSTGSKLPDFRGTNGVWTLQQQGRAAEGVDFTEARPGVSHKAILALHNAGYIKTIITQNVDGLDRKVGIPPRDLIEIHGNLFLEKCDRCKREYVRDEVVMSVGMRETGRQCDGNERTGKACRGRLRDVTLDWDTPIDRGLLARIQKAWKDTEHLLCLGTSLEIVPMGSLPRDARDRGIFTTTVNYQETAHERTVQSAIHSDVKLVLTSLCVALKVPVNAGETPDEVPIPMRFVSSQDEDREGSEPLSGSEHYYYDVSGSSTGTTEPSVSERGGSEPANN